MDGSNYITSMTMAEVIQKWQILQKLLYLAHKLLNWHCQYNASSKHTVR